MIGMIRSWELTAHFPRLIAKSFQSPGTSGKVCIPLSSNSIPETLAGILAAGTNGLIINAASTDVITLRGLDINGFGTGLSGVKVLGNMPKAVNIEECTIYRFQQLGVDWSTNAGTLGQLNIRNSVIKNNGGDGVAVTTSAGQVKGSFIQSSFNGNGNGVHARANSRLTALHCDFSGNTSNGVLADGGTGVIRISISQLANNGANGANAAVGGVVSLNSCDIYNNISSGALVSGGEVDTYNNNRIFANGVDLCASCTQKTFN
jgi:hypothetical protein